LRKRARAQVSLYNAYIKDFRNSNGNDKVDGKLSRLHTSLDMFVRDKRGISYRTIHLTKTKTKSVIV